MKKWNARKVMKLCLVCIFVFSINTLGARAAEYFVATTGNDSNPGTIGNPFRTLEKAARVMGSGDTMYIRTGTYQRGSGTLNIPSGGGTWETATTIKAYNNEEVIITPFNDSTLSKNGGTDILSFPNSRSWIILDGLILDGLNQNGGKGGAKGIRLSLHGHHFRLINMEIRYTAESSVLSVNAHSNQFINSHFHHADHRLPSSSPDFDRRAYGLYLSSENNLVMGCEFNHNRGRGAQLYSGADYKPHNNTLIGNVFHENDRSGLGVSSGTGNVLINNISYGNGTGALSGYTGEERWGITANWGGHGTVIYNNTLYDNGFGELHVGGSSTNNVIVRNNIFYGTSGNHAVRLDSGTTGTVVTNNLIYHTKSGLEIRNNGSAAISDNIIGQNPLFVSERKLNFRLQPDSPAIGHGAVLTEVKDDFDHVKRNSEGPFDCGAFAFLGSSLGPPLNLVIIGSK